MPKNIPISLPDTTTRIPQQNPITGRAVISFPTPIIADRIITEYVSAEIGSYTPLTYGTKWSDVQHGAFQADYPDFELVYQAPADTNGYTYRRVWCNPRTDQQLYNYSIEYAQNNPAYPIVTRLKVVKRSEYQPTAPLTPDEVYTSSLLVQEKLLNQTDPPEINSEYVTVASIYEPIPGPQVTSTDFDSTVNALVESVRQVVLESDQFNPDSVTNLLQMDESPDGQFKKLRAYSFFPDLPATRVEYKTGKYPFPTLVTDITTSVVSLDTTPTNRSFVEWHPTMKDDPNAAALYRVTTEFFNSEPSPETIYVFNTQNLVYKGISFSISINSVLNDSITMAASFTGDPNYGDLSESITFNATTPSATEYLALIGTYVTVGSDITQWRGGIFTRQKTEVLLV